MIRATVDAVPIRWIRFAVLNAVELSVKIAGEMENERD